MNDLPRRLPIWPGAPGAADPKRHVCQRRGPDCAIAAVATITGVTYDQAASAAFSLRNDGLGGMSAHAIKELLYRLTDEPWRLTSLFRTRVRLSSMIFNKKLCVACITSPGIRPRAHAIVARKLIVYDGSLDEPVSCQEHPLKNWYVAWSIERDLE